MTKALTMEDVEAFLRDAWRATPRRRHFYHETPHAFSAGEKLNIGRDDGGRDPVVVVNASPHLLVVEDRID